MVDVVLRGRDLLTLLAVRRRKVGTLTAIPHSLVRASPTVICEPSQADRCANTDVIRGVTLGDRNTLSFGLVLRPQRRKFSSDSLIPVMSTTSSPMIVA